MAPYNDVVEETSLGGARAEFPPTTWSTVLRAQDGSPQALGRLLERAWKPIYFYIRRRGSPVEEAKDLTQEFLAHFIEKGLVERVDAARGRFRTFLLAILRNFLQNERRKERAEKRNPGRPPGDFEAAEKDLAGHGIAEPDEIARRAWALDILALSTAHLREELGPAAFAAVRSHLAAAAKRPSYEETAKEHRLTVTDVRNLLHRARTRLRELVTQEILQTVEGPAQLDEEIADLFRGVTNP